MLHELHSAVKKTKVASETSKKSGLWVEEESSINFNESDQTKLYRKTVQKLCSSSLENTDDLEVSESRPAFAWPPASKSSLKHSFSNIF